MFHVLGLHNKQKPQIKILEKRVMERRNHWPAIIRGFVVFLVFGFVFLPGIANATTEPFTTTGAATWTAPAGVTSVLAEVWAGGGQGGGNGGIDEAGGGGAGGGYSAKTITVIPGNPYDYFVGAGGTTGTFDTDGQAGEDSWFLDSLTVLAKGGGGGTNGGGSGGAGGTAPAGAIGTTIYTGGAGAAGIDYVPGPQASGGGGGGAGSAANGGNASGITAGTGGSPDGGNGGAGKTTNSNGGAGSTLGGGGGGGNRTGSGGKVGGAGARGQVQLTYTVSIVAPTILTADTNSVTATTATASSTITATGGVNATDRGFAYGTDSTLSTVIATTTDPGTWSTGAYSASLTSLSCNTTYYLRAYAVNSAGTTTASIANFTTSACVPGAPTGVSAVAGNGQATVSFTAPVDNGGSAILYYTASSSPSNIAGYGASSPITVTGLTNGTPYTFTVTATNAVGTSTASSASNSIIASTTPTVSTSAASSLSTTGATLNGSLDDTGGDNATTEGFQYGKTTSYGSTASETGSFSTGSFSSSIASLTCHTTYHVRSFATNSAGTSYGSDATFTTSGCPGNGAPGSIGGGGGVYVPPEPSRPAIYYPDGTVTYLSQPIAPATPGPSPTTPPPSPSAPSSNIPHIVPVPSAPAVTVPTKPSAKTSVSEAVSSVVALLKHFALSAFTSNDKQKLPTEVVFATPSGLDHFDVNSQSDIHVLQGKSIDLSVKVDKPVTEVTGYLTIKKIDRATALNDLKNQANRSRLAAVGASVEDKLVLETFKYADPDGDGIYTATIDAPKVRGEYDIMTVLEYKDTQLGFRELHLTAVVDPEGYVYTMSGVLEARIPNAVVTLLRQNPDTKSFTLWPAQDYKQVNPQTTDQTGTYSFLVPEGTYQLTVSVANYYDHISEPFTVVQGAGVHENIELAKRTLWKSLWRWFTELF